MCSEPRLKTFVFAQDKYSLFSWEENGGPHSQWLDNTRLVCTHKGMLVFGMCVSV